MEKRDVRQRLLPDTVLPPLEYEEYVNMKMFAKRRAFIPESFRGTIFAAILGIFVIPMICGFIILQYNTKATNADVIKIDKIMLSTISGQIARELTSVEAIADALPNSENFKKLNSYGVYDPGNLDFVTDAYDMSRELKEYIVKNSAIDDVYMIFNQTNMVVSSAMFDRSEDFFRQYYRDTDLSFEAWRGAAFSELYSQYHMVRDEEQQYIEFFFNSTFFKNDPNPAIIVIRVPAMYLTESIAEIYDFENKELFVVDKWDQVILHLGESLFPAPSYEALSNFEDFQKADGYVYTSCKSGYNSWKYMLCTSNRYFADKVRYSRYILTVNIIIYLITAIVFLIIFIVKNYLPIKKIVRMVKGHDKADYESLESIASKYNLYQNYVEKYSEKDRKIRKKELLNSMVSYAAGDAVKQEAEHLGICFISDKFAVILFDVYNCSAIFNGEDMDDAERAASAELIVNNIFSELLEKAGKAYFTTKNDMFVCVLNLKSDFSAWENEIKKLLELGKTVIEKQFNVFMTIHVSRAYHGIAHIYQGYEETLELHKKSRFISNKEIIFTDDFSPEIRGIKGIDNYMEKLVMLVQVGDVDSGIILMKKIFDAFAGERVNVDRFKIYVIRMIHAMTGILDTGDELPADLCDIVNRILEFESSESCIEGLGDLIRYVGAVMEPARNDELPEEKHSRSNDAVIDKIKKYIAEKYNDSSITVAYIGSYVGVTPYYASRIFKEETGENLSDYISRYRVEKAKEFLGEDRHISTAQLYDLVGFGSERTFMRMFQKYEGITVGQYKKMMR